MGISGCNGKAKFNWIGYFIEQFPREHILVQELRGFYLIF